MIVALAFVCMSLAVFESTNVPPNSTDNGDKTPTDFNISSTIGDLLTTISINPEMFDNIATRVNEREDTDCEKCNTTVRDIPGKTVSHGENTVTKLPAPTHVAGTNDTYFRRKNRLSNGTKKASTQTVTTQTLSETSTLRKTVTTSQFTHLINPTKFELTNNTVMSHAMTSIKNFLNGSNAESTTKAFKTKSTLTSPFLGKFSISTKVMAQMAPPVPVGNLVATSTASTSKVVSEMTAEVATQVSAMEKSNAVSIMTLARTTKAIREHVATANAKRTEKPEETTNQGSVVVISRTDTTNMASSITTEATTDETIVIIRSATTMQERLTTTERTTEATGGKTTGESIKDRSRNTNGVTTIQVQGKETGRATKVIRRTTPGVTKKVIQERTTGGAKMSQGKINATPNSENVATKVKTKKITEKKASATINGLSEMTDTATNARTTIATDVLTQLLEIMDTTTKNESKTTADISRHGLSTTSATTSIDTSSITPSSTSTKTLDRRATLANELGKVEFPRAREETALNSSEYENGGGTETTDEDTGTTTDSFTGTSIWSSAWPMESTTEEKDTDDILPLGNLFESTTQSNKTTQNIFEKTIETTSKTTPIESEEMAPPVRDRFNGESFESTTEQLEDVSSGTTSSIIAVSNTKGKVHLLHKPFMIHPLERYTVSGSTNSGATHKSREKKTNASQSHHSASHERRKGTQSPSLSGFSPTKKQRKSLFRKNKNSETTPVKSS